MNGKSRNSTGTKIKKISPRSRWTIKITIVTFLTSGMFSFLSEISSKYLNVVISVCILCLLILVAIVTDGIGVAATACDEKSLYRMKQSGVKYSDIALKLVKNAEKISNICCDVLGDICGIISGSCLVAITLSLSFVNIGYWLNILLSALVAAATVGGKAFNKSVAIKHAPEVMILTSKLVSIFIPKKRIKENATRCISVSKRSGEVPYPCRQSDCTGINRS